MFLIVVLIVHDMNQCFKPEENINNYRTKSQQQCFFKLISLDTQLRQVLNTNNQLLQNVFNKIRNEYNNIYTSAPKPKGTILYNIRFLFHILIETIININSCK